MPASAGPVVPRKTTGGPPWARVFHTRTRLSPSTLLKWPQHWAGALFRKASDEVILRQALIAIAVATIVVALADLFMWTTNNGREAAPETRQTPTNKPDEGQ